jgi:hypothetical protein
VDPDSILQNYGGHRTNGYVLSCNGTDSSELAFHDVRRQQASLHRPSFVISTGEDPF